MSISQIREGSRFINEKLKDKGYFSSADNVHRLLFNSIDLERLMERLGDEEESGPDNEQSDVSVTSTMLENDKHIINIIYELLDKLEKSKTVKEQTIFQHLQQVNEIAKLHKKIDSLNGKLAQQQEKLNEKDIEIISLNQSLKDSRLEKSLIKKERNHLKSLNENLKEKNKMALKRKNLEIDELRNKLIIKVNSITTVKNSNSLSNSSSLSQRGSGVDSSASGTGSNSLMGPPSRPQNISSELIDLQTQKLLENSSNLIYDLILNNEVNCNFLNQLNRSFDILVRKISTLSSIPKNIDDASGLNGSNTLLNKMMILPNLKQFLSEISTVGDHIKVDDDLNVAINNISNFSELKKSFIEKLNLFDDQISEIFDESSSNSDSGKSYSESAVNGSLNKDDVVAKLKDEVETLKLNWMKLNENAENWKNLYKQSNSSSIA